METSVVTPPSIPAHLPGVNESAPIHASPIIVASDGRPQSDVALRVAARHQRGDEPVIVVGVLEPLPIVSPDDQRVAAQEVEAALAEELRSGIRGQISRVVGADADWLVDIRLGHGPTQIVAAAEAAQAGLIVLGLGRHLIADRLCGDETALELLRMARVPVLAVARGSSPAPRSVVVAVDFGEASRRALLSAIDMATEAATIHLVHVTSFDIGFGAWQGQSAEYSREIERQFERLIASVNPRHHGRIARILLRGDPASEVLSFVAEAKADLLVMGTHGHGFITRTLLGGVATTLLRGAACGVLAIPHAPHAARTTPTDGGVSLGVPIHQWTLKLAEFSKRNAGRRGVLEVAGGDAEEHARQQELPFADATYRPNEASVQLTFGPQSSGGGYVAQQFARVKSIRILQDARGQDLALWISHDEEQTLVIMS